jgi:hypothetical protein
MMKPLGFNLVPQNHSLNFREFVQYLMPFIDAVEHEDEATFRNLREFIEVVAFGSSIIETQDRRRLRAIIASLFCPSIISENFKFLEPDSTETDVWKLPGDGTSLQFLDPIPLFASLDVMMVNKRSNSVVRSWNLSLWLSAPFLSILAHPAKRMQEEEVEESPEPITESQMRSEKLFLAEFWTREIVRFNCEPRKIDRAFLTKSAFPHVIELESVRDPGGLFQALRFQTACDRKVSVESLHLEFEFGPPKEVDFVLDHLYLFNGRIEREILVPPEGKLFSRVEHVGVSVVTSRKQLKKFYVCPMFKRPVFEQTGEFVEIRDGEVTNFVIDVIIETEKGDRFWLLNSTAFYIDVPENFLTTD